MRRFTREGWSQQPNGGLQVRSLVAPPLQPLGSGPCTAFHQVTQPHCLHFIYPVSPGPSFADSCAAGSSFTIQLAADPPDNKET